MKKLRNIMVAGAIVAGGLVAPVVIAAPAQAMNVCTVTAKEYTSAQKWVYCDAFHQYNKSPRCYGDVIKCTR